MVKLNVSKAKNDFRKRLTPVTKKFLFNSDHTFPYGRWVDGNRMADVLFKSFHLIPYRFKGMGLFAIKEGL